LYKFGRKAEGKRPLRRLVLDCRIIFEMYLEKWVGRYGLDSGPREYCKELLASTKGEKFLE
jgi:hypothetical protein